MAAPERWPHEVPPSGTAAWYVRGAPLTHGRWRVRCHVHDRHTDGEVIAEPGTLDDTFLLWDADVDSDGRPVLTVNPAVTPTAPPVWFVHLDERHTDPPATLLVAFATDHLPPGTVVTDPMFFHMPVRSDDQVGAIRWWHGEAVVDQLFVQHDMRRRHMGTVLVYAASAFHQFNGWNGRLHSDGRRTTLGEALVTGLRHPERIAKLEKLMPPMDPDAVQP
ncbi:MAG: hypothetical protein Q7V57_08180 [Actinomycetota bacterium]|nr:hypothetical protein [Actinomycetota bacterium]